MSRKMLDLFELLLCYGHKLIRPTNFVVIFKPTGSGLGNDRPGFGASQAPIGLALPDCAEHYTSRSNRG